MLIESKIKRRVTDPVTEKVSYGTLVELGRRGQRKYHFKPKDPADPDSPHVCEIANTDDIGTLLGIKEGYRVYDEKAAAAEAAADLDDDDTDGKDASGDGTGDDKDADGDGLTTYEKMSRGQLRTMIKERTGKAAANNAANKQLIAILVKLDAEGE